MNAILPSQNSAEDASRILKSAADSLRLQILAVLSANAFSVSELSQIFAVKQNGMSHHLKTLATNQLLTTRREGNTIFYRRSDEPLSTFLGSIRRAIFQTADALVLDSALQENLSMLFDQRAQAAQQFFIDNAAAFKEQQDLIAEFDVYGPEVEKVLAQSALPDHTHALEVGPGCGEFLPVLAAQFNQVTALELSATMLERSRQFCEQKGRKNVDFVLGDTRHCAEMGPSLDCAVINMVLHHSAAPSQLFEDVALALKPKAVLIVCELSQHDQDWVKQACGDQWQGFSREELLSWATRSGFDKGRERYIALRNGFQVQIHQFIKH